jgi:hypothetical protein
MVLPYQILVLVIIVLVTVSPPLSLFCSPDQFRGIGPLYPIRFNEYFSEAEFFIV